MNPEIKRTPEVYKDLTEADLRTGLLISLAIQVSVESTEQLYEPLPEDLKMVAQRRIFMSSIRQDNPTEIMSDYLVEDEELCEWIGRDADDNYILTAAGNAQMTCVYAELHENPIAWRALDSVILNTLPE
jgi:hypothetical protein